MDQEQQNLERHDQAHREGGVAGASAPGVVRGPEGPPQKM